MAFSEVKKYFKRVNLADRIMVFSESSATVQQAAAAVGCESSEIVKTMTFLVADKPLIIVCSGDARIDNGKYKGRFLEKAKMIPASEVEELVGHDVGGVCPFAIKEDVLVYLDESLRGKSILYPGAGSDRSVIRLSLEELEEHAAPAGWVDVCKLI